MKSTDIKKLVDQYFANTFSENFKLKENILYKVPITDFIIGFCFEKSRNDTESSYVWSFIQPLYVPNDSIVLSFGKRLENKLWKLKGDHRIENDILKLVSLAKAEVDIFFQKVNTIEKFYKFFENKCDNLRMNETLVYSAIYSNNKDSKLILNNFINLLEKENLSINWISDMLKQMKNLKSILDDKNELQILFNKTIIETKTNLNIELIFYITQPLHSGVVFCFKRGS